MAVGAGGEAEAEARLYVILGSHACRTAMLMLDHKRVPYRPVELPSGLHPAALRLAGFSGSRRSVRTVDGRVPALIGTAERMGTVPALRMGGRRVQTNREIARFLEELRPHPPLFPADQHERQRVEEVERWGDETLQMTARRLALCAARRGHLSGGGEDGRLGPLLFRQAWVRQLAVLPFSFVFAARPGVERTLLDESRRNLDRVDGWIADGVVGGDELFAADFMLAPSLALLDYHVELREDIRHRPAGELLDRLLPAQ